MNDSSSIESRIDSGYYESAERLVGDVETVSTALLDSAQSRNSLPNGLRHYASSAQDNNLVNRAMAFKQYLNSLVLRGALSASSKIKTEDPDDENENVMATDNVLADSRGSKTVLTLYGSAPQPKQLFSSTQQPIRINASDPSTKNSSAIEVLAPLNENSLPPGIATTKIAPYHPPEPSTTKKRTPTIKESFRPHSSLAPLDPPRQSKHITRGPTVNWYDPYEAELNGRASHVEKNNYTHSALPTGQWLYYSSSPSPAQISSHDAMRKQRDRALSFGDSKPNVRPEELVEHQHAKDKALFRSAYSSFAPTHDNAAAIIPEDTRRQMWWGKFGQARFKAWLSLQYPEDELGSVDATVESATQQHDLVDLEEAVKAYVPEETPKEFMSNVSDNKDEVDEKDVEEILKEISDALETLSSFQRIRNLSLPSTTRSGGSQNPELAGVSGSPTNPSPAEFDIYEMLRTNLSLMVQSLPPYAVAKLNGDQLDDLNISTWIVVDNLNYAGTMEEDDYTAQKKQPASSAVAASTGRTSTPNLSVASRPVNFQTPASGATQFNQRTYASNTRLPQSSGGQPQQYYAPRPPLATPYGQSGTPQSYQASRPTPSTSQRPPYPPNQYSHNSNSQYGQGSNLQQFQRPTVNGYGPNYSSQHTTTPSQTPSGQFPQRPTQPGYQQRAQDSAFNAAAARSASPQKPPPTYSTPPRNSFSNSNSTTQPRYFQQQPPNHPSSQTPAATPAQSGGSGNPPQKSPSEQSMLIDRNKAQLATSRQSSGTPPPPNGQYAGPERSMTPGGGQLNGTAVTAAVGQ